MITLILGLIFVPVSIQAAAKTQKEAEAQVASVLLKLANRDLANDYFGWDIYIPAASKLINKALQDFPKSMYLHKKLQNLTLGILSDGRLSIDKKPIRDSLVSYYKKLYDDNPNSEFYLYLYGRVADDMQATLKLAETAIKKNKKSYWAYILQGETLMDLRRYKDAEKALLKAVKLKPNFLDTYSDLASLYYFLEQPEKAVRNALKACELTPHYSLVRYPYYFGKMAGEKLEDKEILVDLERAYYKKFTEDREEDYYAIYNVTEELYNAYLNIAQEDSARLYLAYMDAFATPLGKGDMVNLNGAILEASFEHKDAALKLLRKAFDKGFYNYGRINDIPEFEFFKDDPELKNILEDMKTKAQKELIAGLTNNPAPDFTLPTTEGDSVSLSKLKGKMVLLDFWGIGCGPCYRLMPVLERFYQTHKSEVYMYGIESWNNSAEDVIATAKKLKIAYPNLLGSAKVSQAYGVRGVPHLVIISPKGKIVHIQHGFAAGKGYAQQMFDELEWLLEKSK